ncbi:MAG: hypothetical protein A2W31_03610 [Planctomycetes bacterium RBG_16_64_10]|nr:MAG: hypothetical protein A2W31_03610 [Planctomycetes bacterium RBG_16_64_10]
MACQFEIYFSAAQYPAGTEWASAALDLVEQLEEQLSVYRPQSQLSEINRSAGRRAVPVEPWLFGLLRQAQTISAQTHGAFDMTTGPLSRAWGFCARSGPDPVDHDGADQASAVRPAPRDRTRPGRRVPGAAQLSSALARVGSERLQLDEQTDSIRFLTPGMEINVHGIGKGYALDRCAALLRSAGMQDFLMHGGQSSVVAAGSHPALPGRGWAVGIRHPLCPDRRLAELLLRDRALGTSGSGTQFFRHRGAEYGHLIDPRTGYPAKGVYSVTVLARTAAEADALATALYVLGPEGARQHCATHPHRAMLMVGPGPQEGAVTLHQHGLTANDWRQLADPTAE